MQSIAPTDDDVTRTADVLLSELTSAILSEGRAPGLARLSVEALNMSDQDLADARVKLHVQALSGPRWWVEFISQPASKALVESRRTALDVVERITDAENTALADERVQKLLAKLKRFVSEKRLHVEGDLDSCLAHARTLAQFATHDDPVLHFERLATGVLADLEQAEQLCDAASSASPAACQEALTQLTAHTATWAAGTRMVTALADHINDEINAKLTVDPSED